MKISKNIYNEKLEKTQYIESPCSWFLKYKIHFLFRVFRETKLKISYHSLAHETNAIFGLLLYIDIIGLPNDNVSF